MTASLPGEGGVGHTEPDWIKSMREHYVRTGFYRAQDVQRLLGDPRKSFQGRPLDDLAMASRISE